MTTPIICATIGLVLGCIAAASMSEIAVLYFGDSMIVRVFTFYVTLALTHAIIAIVASKMLGKRGNTIYRG